MDSWRKNEQKEKSNHQLVGLLLVGLGGGVGFGGGGVNIGVANKYLVKLNSLDS